MWGFLHFRVSENSLTQNIFFCAIRARKRSCYDVTTSVGQSLFVTHWFIICLTLIRKYKSAGHAHTRHMLFVIWLRVLTAHTDNRLHTMCTTRLSVSGCLRDAILIRNIFLYWIFTRPNSDCCICFFEQQTKKCWEKYVPRTHQFTKHWNTKTVI